MRRILWLARPLAIALSIFIFLNLALAIEDAQSSATRVWLYLRIREPWLSVFASVLGVALAVPHSFVRHSGVRWVLGGVLFGFAILVGANVIGYYHRLHEGLFRTALPVPFGLVILIVLLTEFGRIWWWAPVVHRWPAPAWVFVRGVFICLAFFGLISLHIVSFGWTDYRQRVDAAVILGAKVADDGELSAVLRDRVETGIELYKEGWVRYLIMSGAAGPNGLEEPEHMASYAHARGVPLSQIILDREGFNTQMSAKNCGEIARRQGFTGLLTVSQDFHCARVKLIFERAGTPCFTVPARPVDRPPVLFRPNFFLLREVLAYPFYFLYYS